MGSIVELRCGTCSFSSGPLRVGWGKAGRAKFWGAIGHCESCKTLKVADLNLRRATREDPRCEECNSVLALIEGTSVMIPCPSCHTPLDPSTVGSWA